MFWETMKRQFIWFCLFACGFGATNIIESVVSFDIIRLLVNVFMMLVFAFILCVVFYLLDLI